MGNKRKKWLAKNAIVILSIKNTLPNISANPKPVRKSNRMFFLLF